MKQILCLLLCVSLFCLPCKAETDLPSAYLVREEDHTEVTAPIISPEMEAKKEPKETSPLPLILSALCFMISACLYAIDLRRKERR